MVERNSPPRLRFACVRCGRSPASDTAHFCSCGGMVDVEYDPSQVTLHDSPDPFVRYRDLLPMADPDSLIPAGLQATPTIHAQRLGDALGLEYLYLKNETVLPTRSTKDRMAVAAHSFLREAGIGAFVASSTGNSSTALARYARLVPGVRLFLFSAEEFLDRLQFTDAPGVTVFSLTGATFVEACEQAAAFAARTGVRLEGGFFNVARREGLKTAFLEACEAVPRPIDRYVQSISSAMGVYGVYKGAKEFAALGRLQTPPRLLCVQQERCCPMVSAFQAGSPVIRPEDVVSRPSGIAHAILRGNPTRSYPYIREIVLESCGTMVAVSDSEILEARDMVRELEGISCCNTAATAVAGLARAVAAQTVGRSETVLLSLTGADRSETDPPKRVCRLERCADGWRPSADSDIESQAMWENPL